MEDNFHEMARRCFGYGRWDAPFWFIGPEQGQGSDENDDLAHRFKAWCDLGSDELCDLEQFHLAINERRWQRKLQQTWRPLILLLMTFLEKPADKESLLSYQRDKWGRANGETCVIELSGLAARSSAVHRDRETFRQQRIEVIREKLNQLKHNRRILVIMYGKKQLPSWEAIAGQSFGSNNIRKLDGITYAWTPHPVAFGMTNKFWTDLGSELRQIAGQTDAGTQVFSKARE